MKVLYSSLIYFEKNGRISNLMDIESIFFIRINKKGNN